MPAAPATASRRIRAIAPGALRGTLWQADQLATSALPTCPSGFATLDAELPGGGWPASGLSELLLGQPGSGEVRLLAPALSRLAGAGNSRELVWAAPPLPPYAPALHAIGLPLDRLLWLQPGSEADAAWATEQVLRSGAASAVLWWSRDALPATLRRLHLAALAGTTPLFALRPWGCRRQSSPAPLRLAIEPAAGGRLSVLPFKRRGPSAAQPLLIDLPQPARRDRVSPVLPSSLTPTGDVVVGAAPALAAA